MGKYFGTDGFRGEANNTLTVEHAFKVGRYLGYYLCRKNGGTAKVAVGKDTRRSSYMFEYSLAAGLTASGCDCYLLHVTTTPSVSYVVKTEKFDAGIMISASHNAFYDNGIKLLNSSGYKIESEVEEEIEAYIDGELGEIPLATRDSIGRTVDYAMGRNRYVGYLISLATRSYKGMRVGLDCSNGSAFSIAKSVFDALGADTYVINAEPNGLNINLDCGSTHIQGLQELVVREKLDLGFAFDGDADRCLAVDSDGNIVDGDKILYICANYMKERDQLNNNKVVATVMSNLGLFRALEKNGISVDITKVGDKYVSENMRNTGNCIGGEQSGHIIFSKYANTGDGILTAIKIMEVVLEKKENLKKLLQEFKTYPQLLKNIKVFSKKETQDDEYVKKAINEVEKELGDRGRILVRESGTEPLIRVMVEAETYEECELYVDKVIDVIKSRGYERKD